MLIRLFINSINRETIKTTKQQTINFYEYKRLYLFNKQA